MKTVTGVFASQSDAQHAMTEMCYTGVRDDRITLLTPGSSQTKLEAVPNVAAEQPGMGKTVGAEFLERLPACPPGHCYLRQSFPA